VDEAFEAGGRGRRVSETARHSRYHSCDVTSVEELRGLLEECEGTPAIYFALPPAVTQLPSAFSGRELPKNSLRFFFASIMT
jgi:glucose-6-phosphate 1-dehydrogenase